MNPTKWDAKDAQAYLLDGTKFRSRMIVDAHQVSHNVTWCTSTGSGLTAQVGDWLLSDGQETWSVDERIFAATYSLLPNGGYQKTALITAKQLTENIVVDTLEGPADGRIGDWLVSNPTGEVWPVGKEEFLKRYTPADDN